MDIQTFFDIHYIGFDLFLHAVMYMDDKGLLRITHTDCHVHQSVCEYECVAFIKKTSFIAITVIFLCCHPVRQ